MALHDFAQAAGSLGAFYDRFTGYADSFRELSQEILTSIQGFVEIVGLAIDFCGSIPVIGHIIGRTIFLPLKHLFVKALKKMNANAFKKGGRLHAISTPKLMRSEYSKMNLKQLVGKLAGEVSDGPEIFNFGYNVVPKNLKAAYDGLFSIKELKNMPKYELLTSLGSNTKDIFVALATTTVDFGKLLTNEAGSKGFSKYFRKSIENSVQQIAESHNGERRPGRKAPAAEVVQMLQFHLVGEEEEAKKWRALETGVLESSSFWLSQLERVIFTVVDVQMCAEKESILAPFADSLLAPVQEYIQYLGESITGVTIRLFIFSQALIDARDQMESRFIKPLQDEKDRAERLSDKIKFFRVVSGFLNKEHSISILGKTIEFTLIDLWNILKPLDWLLGKIIEPLLDTILNALPPFNLPGVPLLEESLVFDLFLFTSDLSLLTTRNSTRYLVDPFTTASDSLFHMIKGLESTHRPAVNWPETLCGRAGTTFLEAYPSTFFSQKEMHQNLIDHLKQRAIDEGGEYGERIELFVNTFICPQSNGVTGIIC